MARVSQALTLVLKIILIVAMLLLVSITFVDVIGRYLFSRPLPGAFEWQEVLMAVAIFTGLPLVTIDREHVTVGIFEGLFARWGWLHRVQRVTVTAVSCFAAGFVALRLYDQGSSFLRWGDTSAFMRIPYWPVAYFMASMAAVAVLVLAAQAILIATGRDDAQGDSGGSKF